MRVYLILIIALIAGCTSIDWQEQTVSEITDRTTIKRNVWAITQFEVKSVGVGEGPESGRWYLNSGLNYRSSFSLNLHLTPSVVSQFSEKYNIENVSELIGRQIRVKGKATPKPYCVHFGCPSRVSPNTPEMYLQTQMLISDLSNISIQ